MEREEEREVYEYINQKKAKGNGFYSSVIKTITDILISGKKHN